MSIMYVMALTLATELTGKDKVHVSCYYTNSNHALLEDDRNLRAKFTSSLSIFLSPSSEAPETRK